MSTQIICDGYYGYTEVECLNESDDFILNADGTVTLFAGSESYKSIAVVEVDESEVPTNLEEFDAGGFYITMRGNFYMEI